MTCFSVFQMIQCFLGYRCMPQVLFSHIHNIAFLFFLGYRCMPQVLFSHIHNIAFLFFWGYSASLGFGGFGLHVPQVLFSHIHNIHTYTILPILPFCFFGDMVLLWVLGVLGYTCHKYFSHIHNIAFWVLGIQCFSGFWVTRATSTFLTYFSHTYTVVLQNCFWVLGASL